MKKYLTLALLAAPPFLIERLMVLIHLIVLSVLAQ